MKKLFLAMACLVAALGVMAQGAKLPENITLKTVDGKTVQSSILNNDGKPMIISFWATWCGPCLLELKTISEVYDEWVEETGVKLVAISIDDVKTSFQVKKRATALGWPFEVYIDENKDFASALSIGQDPPYTIIVNGQGEIVWQHKGFQPGAEEEVIEQVRKLLE